MPDSKPALRPNTSSEAATSNGKKRWTRPVVTAVNIKKLTEGTGVRRGDGGGSNTRRTS